MPFSIFRDAQVEYLLQLEKACQDHGTIPNAQVSEGASGVMVPDEPSNGETRRRGDWLEYCSIFSVDSVGFT